MSSLTVNYKRIYSRFLSKVEAYDLTNMVEENAYDLMTEWMHSVRSEPLIRKLFTNISLSDDDGMITFELKTSQGDDESDEEFVLELFGWGIAKKWVEPKYFSTLNTAQIFTGKEVKFYSQANHLDALENLYKNSERKLYKLVNQYGFGFNTYLNGGES